MRLEDDIDVSRGDMICRPENQPTEAREIDAMVCWMSERPLSPSARYRVKHTTRTALAKVDDLRYRIDVNTLHRDQEASGLELNEIGRLRLRLSAPLFVDEYRAQPRDRQLHPDRRVDQRHRRCGHGVMTSGGSRTSPVDRRPAGRLGSRAWTSR